MGVVAQVRHFLIQADAVCTAGRGLRMYREWTGRRLEAKIFSCSSLHSYTVHYPSSTLGSFASLCDHYGSDKGTRSTEPHPYGHPPHSYADFYASLFDHCRLSVRKVFECGLGTNDPTVPSNMGSTGKPGASLRAWRDYFPNAMVHGADIDRNILFSEERIATYYVDQTSRSSIVELWNHEDLTGFDLIVDDGLHTFEAGVTFFEASHAQLRPGGIYVIEDVTLLTLERFVEYFSPRTWEVAYVTLLTPTACFSESNLVLVRAPDHDSCGGKYRDDA